MWLQDKRVRQGFDSPTTPKTMYGYETVQDYNERGRHRTTIESFYYGDVSREYLIDFYGLKQPDIEWYNIEEVAE